MDNSIQEHESSGEQDRKSFLAGLLIIGGIVNWLVSFISLIKLTEEEQQDAGIYPGRMGDE